MTLIETADKSRPPSITLAMIASLRDQLLAEISSPDQAKLKMRQMIQALFPQILQLLEYGYTFEDICGIARSAGVEIKLNTLKTYYYQLHRQDEMATIIEAQKKTTQQSILSLGSFLGRVLPDMIGRQINSETAGMVSEKIEGAVGQIRAAIKETPLIAPAAYPAPPVSLKKKSGRAKQKGVDSEGGVAGIPGTPPSLEEIREILDKRVDLLAIPPHPLPAK